MQDLLEEEGEGRRLDHHQTLTKAHRTEDQAMAQITQKPTVTLELNFRVTEAEARALDALVGYGDDAFIAAFKEKLGKVYIEDHEAGLRSFFQSVRGFVPPLLERANKARKAFES
jgi:hypothetical protein